MDQIIVKIGYRHCSTLVPSSVCIKLSNNFSAIGIIYKLIHVLLNI